MRITHEKLSLFFNKYLSTEMNRYLYFILDDEDCNDSVKIGFLDGGSFDYNEAIKTVKNLILNFDNVVFEE